MWGYAFECIHRDIDVGLNLSKMSYGQNTYELLQG